MPESAPTYDLMLVLSTSAEEDRRKRILSDVESAISGAGGSIERNDDWGVRGLTYRIAHETDGEYHLLQFTGPVTLLESLQHSLRITDGVLRFRIIKQTPGTPAPPQTPPPVVAAVGASSRGGAATATAEAVDAEAVEAEAEAEPAEVAAEEEAPPAPPAEDEPRAPAEAEGATPAEDESEPAGEGEPES